MTGAHPDSPLTSAARKPWPIEHAKVGYGFAKRVLGRFRNNHGGIFASAIAFDALMSMVPLLALLSVALSRVVEPRRVQQLLEAQLELLLPGAADRVIQAYTAIVSRRAAAGLIGLLALLAFGTSAFRTIRKALWVIFDGVEAKRRQPSRMSRLLPLGFVGISALGLLTGTFVMTLLDALPLGGLSVWGYQVSIGVRARTLSQVAYFIGLACFIASFYRLLPPIQPSLKVALVGGLAAGTVWEVVRRLMVWYLANLSAIGAYYGSLASAVVLLVGLNGAALVLLLGGQVIAELERARRAGVSWHQDPGGPPSSTRHEPQK